MATNTPDLAVGSAEFLAMYPNMPRPPYESGGPAVIHNVIFKTKEGVGETELSAFIERMKSLKREGLVEGIKFFSIGPYSSGEGLNQGFTWGMHFLFEDQASRNKWIISKQHEQAIALILPHLVDGVNSVIAFDWLLEGEA